MKRIAALILTTLFLASCASYIPTETGKVIAIYPAKPTVSDLLITKLVAGELASYNYTTFHGDAGNLVVETDLQSTNTGAELAEKTSTTTFRQVDRYISDYEIEAFAVSGKCTLRLKSSESTSVKSIASTSCLKIPSTTKIRTSLVDLGLLRLKKPDDQINRIPAYDPMKTYELSAKLKSSKIVVVPFNLSNPEMKTALDVENELINSGLNIVHLPPNIKEVETIMAAGSLTKIGSASGTTGKQQITKRILLPQVDADYRIETLNFYGYELATLIDHQTNQVLGIYRPSMGTNAGYINLFYNIGELIESESSSGKVTTSRKN